MNLTTFQTAIQALVKSATGFDDGHAIWANQTRKRPDRPFVELAHPEGASPFFSEDSVDDTPSPTPGNEITLTAKEHVEITVQVRVFSSAVVGSTNAFNLANAIRSFFSRESTTDALGEIALVARETVRDVSLVLETEHEGRAVFALTFRVANLDTETTTYIEHATVETTIAQTNGNVVHTLTIPE
jgi:hypothetical protein